MKILIVGIGLLLYNASVSAQQSYHAYATGVETYDEKSGTWFNDKSISVDFTIRVEQKRLTIGDSKNSTYVLRTWNAELMGWEALDVNGTRWYIIFMNENTDPVKTRISFSRKRNDTNRTYYDVLPM